MLRLINILRSRLPDGRSDQGSAMAAVMGLLAVTVVVSAVILAASVSSLSVTSVNRSAVQAQAAADGGIDATLAMLSKGTCVSPFTSTDAPYYKSWVYWRGATGTWVKTCPTSGDPATQIKVVATGYPDGISPASGITANRRSAEAVYAWSAPTGSMIAGGPAVYAFDAAGFGGSGKLVSINGSDPDVMIKQGNVNCSGGAGMTGDLVVDGGTLELSGSCGVTGSLWASGTITLTGNVPVGGNVVGPSLINTGGQVSGSTWTTGNTRVTWGSSIAGGATASTLTLAGGNIKGKAWSSGLTTWDGGGLVIDGSLTTKSMTGTVGTAKGGITQVPAGPGPGPSAPVKPVVPNWPDFASTASDWSGYTSVPMSGTCDYNAVKAAIDSLGTRKGLLDGRNCTSALTLGDYQKITLLNDLVIVSKSYDLKGSSGFTSSAARKLWLITPDTTKDTKPTCPAGSSFSIGGTFSFTNIATMIYSPCLISIGSSLNFNGQIFGGQAAIAGGATLGYVPIGLPGFDLNTGNASTGGGGSIGTLGGLVSNRELMAVDAP